MEINKVNKGHNIYLLRTHGPNESLLKLGYSSDIRRRLSNYEAHNPFIELIGTFHIDNAKEWENHIHKCFKADVGREWYRAELLPILLECLNGEIDIFELTPLFAIRARVAETLGLERTNRSLNAYRWDDKMKAYYTAYIEQNEDVLSDFNEEEHEEFGGWIAKYEEIGELEAITARGYRQKNMHDYYTVRTPKFNKVVTAHLINNEGITEGFYKGKDLKKAIQNAFNKYCAHVGQKRTAKATDITQFMDATAVQKRVNGKVSRGFDVKIKKVKSVNPLSLFKA